MDFLPVSSDVRVRLYPRPMYGFEWHELLLLLLAVWIFHYRVACLFCTGRKALFLAYFMTWMFNVTRPF